MSRPASGLNAYVTGTAVLAVLGLVAQTMNVPTGTVTDATLLGIGATAVLVGLTESRLLTIKVRGTFWGVTFAEVGVLVGLIFMPTVWVVVGACVGVFASAVGFRRSVVKTVFNFALYTIGTLTAGFVAGQPATKHLQLGAADLARIGGAGVAFGVLSAVGVSLAIALASGGRFRQVFAQGASMSSVVCGINTTTTIAVVALGLWSPATLTVVPPLLGLVFLFYRISIKAQEERDLWQALERASASVGELEEEDVACAVVRNAPGLVLGATCAELVVDAPGLGHGPRVWRADLDGAIHRGLGPGAASSAVATPHDGQPALVQISTAAGSSAAIVVGLIGPRGAVGRLVLSFEGRTRVGDRERQVLSTFGRTVAAALERAWLYDQTRTLASVKAYEAAHDHLTGLANRSLLRDRLGAELATDDGRTTGLLLLDLDHFKSVNDTLGHTVGDRLLVEVARRISDTVGDLDLVARLGGDEFAVLLPVLEDPDSALGTATRVLAALTEPIDVDGLRLSVGASVGVACHPHDARDVEELFQRSDVAMYQAKHDRNAVRRYAASADDSSVSHLEMVAELRAGMDRDEVVLHYQPQVDSRTGRITGVEALARWQHPRRGLLLPDAFIGPVEQSGLLRSFTAYVLDQAVSDCAGWLREGISVTMAVNLSARNLLDRALPNDVAAALTRHRLPAEQLILELTETTMVSEQAVVEEVLADLRRLGVQVSVDDFGTGFSSLALLQRVSVNELKVDRSFVLDMLESENDAAIVRATIDLAHSLGLRAVAEGVENAELLEALKSLGCDLVQGWHLGRPCDRLAVTRLLRGVPEHPVIPAQRRSDSGFRVILPA
jgi:diguanylate cyclase (GGDEF)-like protein